MLMRIVEDAGEKGGGADSRTTGLLVLRELSRFSEMRDRSWIMVSFGSA